MSKDFYFGHYIVFVGVVWTDWIIGIQLIPYDKTIIFNLLPLSLSVTKEDWV